MTRQLSDLVGFFVKLNDTDVKMEVLTLEDLLFTESELTEMTDELIWVELQPSLEDFKIHNGYEDKKVWLVVGAENF